MRERKPIKDPRKTGAVGRAVADMLRDYGVTGARYYKRRHFVVEFEVFEGGEKLSHSYPCTPRDQGSAIKNSLRALEQKIVGAIARAGQ